MCPTEVTMPSKTHPNKKERRFPSLARRTSPFAPKKGSPAHPAAQACSSSPALEDQV